MSKNSSGRYSRHLIPLLGILALASGGVFVWSNWDDNSGPLSGESMAFAAPQTGASKAAVKPKPATKAERDAAHKVISTQLRAFNSGNWAEAVKFQSDGLKQNFKTPEAFGSMIQKLYPAFVRPKKVEFGKAYNVGGHIQMEVSLSGYDDSVTRAIYSLVKEKGNYRVEAVMGGVNQQAVENPNATVT